MSDQAVHSPATPGQSFILIGSRRVEVTARELKLGTNKLSTLPADGRCNGDLDRDLFAELWKGMDNLSRGTIGSLAPFSSGQLRHENRIIPYEKKTAAFISQLTGGSDYRVLIVTHRARRREQKRFHPVCWRALRIAVIGARAPASRSAGNLCKADPKLPESIRTVSDFVKCLGFRFLNELQILRKDARIKLSTERF